MSLDQFLMFLAGIAGFFICCAPFIMRDLFENAWGKRALPIEILLRRASR